MSEAKYGEEFITHEFDEAIAVQSMIVGSARKLAEVHPDPDAKRLIKGMVAADERQLRELRQLGKPYGATGTVEEVAGALGKLAAATLEKASEAESEAYEAHAVLLALKRKQQDSTAALLKIARDRKEAGLRDAAREMLRETKGAAQELADALAVFAVSIASRTRAGRRAADSRGA
jgi:hypothetical protein